MERRLFIQRKTLYSVGLAFLIDFPDFRTYGRLRLWWILK